jgi:hypothetical protein
MEIDSKPTTTHEFLHDTRRLSAESTQAYNNKRNSLDGLPQVKSRPESWSSYEEGSKRSSTAFLLSQPDIGSVAESPAEAEDDSNPFDDLVDKEKPPKTGDTKTASIAVEVKSGIRGKIVGVSLKGCRQRGASLV